MLVFGGGAENPTLMRVLQGVLAETRILHGGQYSGIPSQALEALAFAWLGGKCLLGQRLPLVHVTGAQRPMTLGNILPGDNWPDLLVHLSKRMEITAKERSHGVLPTA